MTTTYIDPTGSNGTGTFLDPKNTWSGLSLSGSNTFLQKAGTTWTGNFQTGSGVGVGTELILGTYNASTGAQITDGTTPAKINGNGATECISTEGRHHVIIDGLELYGTAGVWGPVATHVNAANDHITVRYCTLHDATDVTGEAKGIASFGTNMLFTHNTIYNIQGEGIYHEGDSVEISYNTIHDISQDPSSTGDCIQIAESVYSTNNPYIHHNSCDHSNKDVKQCIIVNVTLGVSTGGRVEFNTCTGYANSSSNWCIEAGFPNMRIIGNRLINGARGIDITANGCTAIGNVITNTSVLTNIKGINANSGTSNHIFLNNVIQNLTGTYSNPTYGIDAASNVSTMTIENNIFKGWTYGIRAVTTSGVTENYNDFNSNSHNRVNTSSQDASLGANSITTDPLIIGNGCFEVQATSPCIGSGVNPGQTVTTYDERTMLAPYSIGAYWAGQKVVLLKA